MSISIKISLQSQKLINKYYAVCPPGSDEHPSIPTVLDLAAILDWLNNRLVVPQIKPEKVKKELEFTLVSLRTELLHDLYLAFSKDAPEEKEKASSFRGKLKFILLSSAGLLITICEGFDSVASIMSIFSLPATVILAAAFIFSFFSAVAFCGLELIQLSQGIGVKLIHAHKLLKIYLRQLEEVKQLRKIISNYNLAELSTQDLNQLELMAAMLQQRFVELGAVGEQFALVLNNKGAKAAKLIFSGIASLLFFGGSFCTGQSASLFILSFFMSSVSPLSIPVLLFSLVLGMAAFTLYWYVQFPDLNSLVSGWFGLDDSRIAVLCDKKLFAHEEDKLTLLKQKIQSMLHLKSKLPEPNKAEPSSEELGDKETHSTSYTHSGSNFFSFRKPPCSSAKEPPEYPFVGATL
jgi:hypothetical protein